MANITLTLEEYQELLDMKEDFEDRLIAIEEKLFPQDQDEESEEDINILP